MNLVVLISANAEWRAVREILSPADVELTPLGETFATTRAGGMPGSVTRYFHGGWGKIAAAASTQYAIDRWQPDLLVNLGTCGGFAGRIERGTIILAERTLLYDIVEQMGDPDEAIQHYATDIDLSWLDQGRQPMGRGQSSIVRSLLISADRDIIASDIPDLIEKYDAVAADWESGAIAWVAKKNSVRCLIMRGVTDLVSPEGGEAYGDISIFHENTKKVVRQLIEGLPEFVKD